MKTFRQNLRSALYVASVVFFVAITLTVFSKSPKFGFYFVSASAVTMCSYLAYSVFAAIMSIELVRNVTGYRKDEVEKPPIL